MTHIQVQPVTPAALLSLFTLDTGAGFWRGYAATLGGALRLAHAQGFCLTGVNLAGADLHGENLRGLDLRLADLRGATLQHADLTGTRLSHALLQHSDLDAAQLLSADTDQACTELLTVLFAVPELRGALQAALDRGEAGSGACWAATLPGGLGRALLREWLRR